MHEIRVDPSALGETGGVLGAAAERVDAARHGLASSPRSWTRPSATPATPPSKPPTWPRRCCGSTG